MGFRLKVTLLFFIAVFTPYIFFSLGIIYYVESLLEEKALNHIKIELKLKVYEIESEMRILKKTISEWSKLDIMYDIIFRDLDKRIAKFFKKVEDKIGKKSIVLATDTNGFVIASNKAELIGKKVFPKSKILYRKGKLYLVFFEKIYVSFKAIRKPIGSIIILYPADYLLKILKSSSPVNFALYNRKFHLNVGYIPKEKDYLSIRKNLGSELDGWELIAYADKNKIFLPVYRIMFFFSIGGVLSVVLALVGAFIVSSRTLKPIGELARCSDYVIKNNDFSVRMPTDRKDELGKIAILFNTLLSSVESYLKRLEEESKYRLKLFKKLTEMFRIIISQESEENLLKEAVRNLKDFLGVNVKFSQKPLEGFKNYELRSNIFEGERLVEKTVGYLCVKLKDSDRETEDFINSVVKLISFQISRLNVLRMEEYLRQKAEEASRAKSMFLANISHELRTPLNAIIGFSQYMYSDEGLDKRYRELSQHIYTSAQHLLGLINDILDYSKAEAGKLKVKKERFNLKEIIEEIETMMKPLAQEKGLNLILEKPNIYLNTDKKALKQILLNLLSNGIKYTENGYVKLEVLKGDKDITFKVKDTGIGIPKDKQSKIFEVFEQLENPLQKKYKGTGLGLALTKKLVELLGGEIGVYSEGEGKGSTFWVRLPTK